MSGIFQSGYEALWRAVQASRRDDVVNLGAGIAFFSILSLVPLLLIIISVLGHILGQSESLFEQIVVWLRQTIPGIGANFVDMLRSLIARKVTSGWLGIGFLFLSASLLFTNMEKSLDIVLKSVRRRNFWHSRLLAIGLIFVTALLFFIPAFMQIVSNLLATHNIPVEIGLFFRGDTFFFLAHLSVFAFLIRVVPNQSVELKYIGSGALLFGVSALCARQLFHAYMNMAFDRFNLIYGSLSVMIVLILWLYYLSVLFLFCGEFVSALQTTRKTQKN